MRAWAVSGTAGSRGRIVPVIREVPEPAVDEVLVRVRICGVCRTDLHLADLELQPRAPLVIPGHEVIGEVVGAGARVSRFATGDRVGIAWLRRTCGNCRACRRGAENLCRASAYTGWDADGGFAEFAVVPEAFAYSLPQSFTDEEAAPLLCSGIIGYRALRRANVPPGGRLGIYGFGASAHLTAQVAIAEGLRVHVLTRSAQARELALQLGAASVGAEADAPPEPLDAAVLFAPVGTLVPPALAALDRGGTLAIAGIHLTDIPALSYERHLFQERTLRSVTANTRDDGRMLLETAARIHMHVSATAYPFHEANRALQDLAHDRVSGVALLVVAEPV